jgi:hypothetical protein
MRPSYLSTPVKLEMVHALFGNVRPKSGWYAAIETSLDSESEWTGCSWTLQDAIDELVQDNHLGGNYRSQVCLTQDIPFNDSRSQASHK